MAEKAKYPWLLQSTGPGFAPRNGQWVAFKPVTSIEGAYTLPSGEVVGVFRAASVDARVTVKDKDGKERQSEPARRPPRVVLVTPRGNNLAYLDENDTLHTCLWFPVEACPALRPITDRDHVPAERLATSRKDWKPEA